MIGFLSRAISDAVVAGVPVDTITLLLLLPAVATFIAAARHIVGLKGFGIFLPAALSVVFLAIGPLLGVAIFIAIIVISSLVRAFLVKTKIKLQYLPRMAILMWFMTMTVFSILLLAPLVDSNFFKNISIFPILFLILLVEDFIRVQLGKSFRTAVNLTLETIFLSLLSFILLSIESIRLFAFQNPEIWLIGIMVANLLLGNFGGLRVLEVIRFRKLLKK